MLCCGIPKNIPFFTCMLLVFTRMSLQASLYADEMQVTYGIVHGIPCTRQRFIISTSYLTVFAKPCPQIWSEPPSPLARRLARIAYTWHGPLQHAQGAISTQNPQTRFNNKAKYPTTQSISKLFGTENLNSKQNESFSYGCGPCMSHRPTITLLKHIFKYLCE